MSAGFGALHDPVDERRQTAEPVTEAGPVRHEPTGDRDFPEQGDRREAAPGRELRDAFPVANHERRRQDDDTLGTASGGGPERSLEIGGAPDLEKLQLHRQRSGRDLDRAQLRRGVCGIPEHGHARDPGDGVLEQLEPFLAQLGLIQKYPGDVASGPGKGGDESRRDRIAFEVERDDRNRRLRVPGGVDGGGGKRDDDIHAELDELGRESRKPLGLTGRPPRFDFGWSPKSVVS
jgi:hypothetical protein